MKTIKYLTMLIIIVTPKLFAQNITSDYSFELSGIKNRGNNKFIIANSILNNEDTNKIFPEIGLIAGSHFGNLNQNSPDNFNQGFIFEIYAKYNLSNEVHPLIAFTYWKSETKEVNTAVAQVPSETIDSKGLKLELDFSLFKFSNITLSLGPSISIENITKSKSAVYGFGTDIKLNLPVWNEKIYVLSIIHYKNGSELLNYGGGFNYSFISYLFGIEIRAGN